MTTAQTDRQNFNALARQHYLWPLLHQADLVREPPMVMAEGHDCHLVDVDGHGYLDLMSGLTRASTLGHSRNDIAEAMLRQLNRLPYAGTAA